MKTLTFSFASPRRAFALGLLSMTVSTTLLVGCKSRSVDPAIASLGAQVLERTVLNDLDKFTVTEEFCEGHVRASEEARYGVAYVDAFPSAPPSLPFEATRRRDQWVLEIVSFTPRGASKNDFERQVKDCANALKSRMNEALSIQAAKERNQASWSATASAPTDRGGSTNRQP